MTHLSETLKLVEVPGEATRTYISHLNYLCAEYKDKDFKWKEVLIDEPLVGKWRIIGTVTADTIDFDCEPYVEETTHFNWCGFGSADISKAWLNYEIPEAICKTPQASFRSLLNSKGARWVNPHGEMPPVDLGIMAKGQPMHDVFLKDMEQWQSAEQSLVKGKLVVLERIK